MKVFRLSIFLPRDFPSRRKDRYLNARNLRVAFVLALLGICGTFLSLGTGNLSAAFKPQDSAPQKAVVSTSAQATADQFTSRRRRTRRTRQQIIDLTRLGQPVRVIVGLNVEFQPEGDLQNTAAIAQRTRIAQAQARLVARLATRGLSNIKQYESIPFVALEADAATMAILESAPEVVSIEEDFMRHATLAESTVLIGATNAWAAGFAGNGQAVAIIDTGVDKTHPFLAGKVVSEACYSSNSSETTSVCPGGAPQSTASGSGINCPVPGCEHGTHVAGIAAGKSQTFSGVARDANIIAIQVFSSVRGCTSSFDCTGAYDSDILLGLQRAQQLAGTFNIAAANLSLGGDTFNTICDGSEASYKAAIDNLRSLGISTVIASGNDGSNGGISSPACVSSAISVGSTGDGSGGSAADAISTFSNSAYFLSLLAPGEFINSSVPGGGFEVFEGTSMATPHVAGAIAVLKSKLPGASVSQILQTLSGTGLSLPDSRNGVIKPRIRVDTAATALAGNVCNFTVNPTTQTVGTGGEQKSINVTTEGGCGWTAQSNVPWISINNGSTGTGSGSVVYTVAANGGLDRSGTLVVAGSTIVVTQSGLPTLSIDDGSYENAIGLTSSGTVCAVNRLAPPRYPAAINGVAVQFPSALGVPVGTPIQIIYGVSPDGGTNINGTSFQTVNSTVQLLDQMVHYPVPPIAAPSGDFVVGYCLTQPAGRLPVLIDDTTTNRRSYVSANGGAFTLIDDISSSFAGNIAIRATLAPRFVMGNSLVLTAESCATVNQTIDPGEVVTVNITLSNAGTEALTSLVATLQATGGVTAPSPPQNYGALQPGASGSQSFTFTADPTLPCSGTITLTLQLQDGAINLSPAVFTPSVGPSATKNYSYGGASTAIVDGGTIEVPITVADTGVIRDVNVRLRLTHTFDADLDIFLVGPDGTTVELSTDNGSSGDNYGTGANNCTGTFTVFDDSASALISSGAPPFAGTFRPEGSLSNFNGRFMSGTWLLRIVDDTDDDVGFVGCWQLEIRSQSAPCCGSSCPFVSNSSRSIGPVGAGIVLSGFNFTGVTGVKFANDVAATFTIDNANQITTSVPAGTVTGPLTITKDGCASLQFPFTVVTCPTVTSLNPVRDLVGANVIITGTNFTGVNSVKFSNNVSAQFSVNNATQITAVVPNGAVTGPLTIGRIGCGDVQTSSFTVCPSITLNPAALPSSTVGVAYNQAITVSGGSGAYTFSLSSGTLPSGVTLSAAGLLSGTTTQAGMFNVTVRATDANGCSGTRVYTLIVNCPTITLAPATLPISSLGVAYSQLVTATGGASPYTFALTAGTLPTGVTLASSGLLSGTPTRAGAFDITIRATDANGCTASTIYRLQVSCNENISVGPALLPGAIGGVPYSQQLSANGGTAPYTFTFSGTLPRGLNLSSSGLLSGTPNAVGSFSFAVTASGANGCSGSRNYTVNVSVTLGGQTGIVYALRDCSGCGNEVFAFAANDQSGALTLLSGFPLSTGFNGTSGNVNERLAIDRVNKRLFVLNGGSARVNVYNINTSTGGLTSAIPSAITLPSGGSWYTILVHPSGSPLLVGDSLGRVASYVITANSATAAAGSPFSTGSARPFGATFSASGDYYYVGGNLFDTFAGFSVNAATGVLTPLSGSPYSTGSSYPLGYAADQSGNLFLTHLGGPARVFATSNGIPVPVTGNPFATGSTESVDGVVHPAGFYIAANRTGNNVHVYRITGSGAATTIAAVPGSPFASGGTLTNAITLNTQGTLLFASNGDSRNITSFSVNSSTGGLTSLGVQSSNTLGTSGRVTGIAHYFDPTPQPNPIPSIASSEPNARAAGSGAFLLTINGFGFVNTSQAKWNGSDRTTSFINSTRLVVSVSAADVSVVGTANLTVVNPAPGGGTSNQSVFTIAAPAVTTSAATFVQGPVAPESIVAAFGNGLAVGTQSASTLQLPFLILGTSVQVRDSLGISRQAPLLFVSPQQVNYIIPVGTAAGEANLTISSGDGKISAGIIQIAPVSLGVFSANADGKGVAAANILRITAANVQTIEDVAMLDMATNTWVPKCFSLGPAGDSVYLVTYGTGVRGAVTSALTATIDGTALPVLFSGPHPVYAGLDQINLGPIPRSLIGKGVVDLVIRVNGQPANTVQFCIN